MRTKISKIKHPKGDPLQLVGSEMTIKGWVRTVRKQKNFSFIEVNDGSTLISLQVVIDETLEGYAAIVESVTTGCSIAVTGEIVESPGKKQALEMKAKIVEVIGSCDSDYPLQKKRHTFEFLRTISHLRPRTNTIGAVSRVSNALSFATHKFFQEEGFIHIHTPIVTASDCEGAGEMFRVTTLDPKEPPKTGDGEVDYTKDFFDRPAYLTVSGQLDAEIYSCALSDVYTFGPTFRAENSNTSRHLAEFWMIEPEMAFANLEDDMDNVEAYLKYVVAYALEHCHDDMLFFNKYIAGGTLIDRLTQLVETPFERASYTYAVRVLEKSGKKFNYPIRWGLDLQTEHERYLAEEYFSKPVIITDYPKEIKAFYMRDNDDGKTVAAMDVLVPKVGEIVGGSQREERIDQLERKIERAGLPKEAYWWYLELRKYGSVPHAGYGVGFERLVQYVTGMENIRDCIPFPRYPGNADF